MKSCLTKLIVAVIATLSSVAGAETKSMVLKDTVHEITVEIKEGDVRCSEIGYGTKELKISVPDLKWISSFDHTNPGELQPCMTAGRCQMGNLPMDLIDGRPGFEQTSLRQTLTEEFAFDVTTNICQRSIVERVEMIIRGKTFRHTRSLDLGNTPLTQCLASFE